MERKRVLKVSSIFTMILSLVLIGWAIAEKSEYKLANILSYIGLFLMSAYGFYLYKRKDRNDRSGGLGGQKSPDKEQQKKAGSDRNIQQSGSK
jgi:hypothetical protein